MNVAIKINEELVKNIDANVEKYSLRTRQNLANTLIRKALDFMESAGYEALLNLPSISETNGKTNKTRD